MNCKQGDLAFIVGAKLYPEINGLVVRCVRRINPGEILRLSNGVQVAVRYDRTADWLIESEGSLLPYAGLQRDQVTIHRTKWRPLGDAYLRPIRDTDAPDETLVWAGKPEQVTV